MVSIHQNTIIYALILLVLIPVCFAEPKFYFKVNDKIDLKIPCYNNNTICSGTSACNITVNYPNGTSFVNRRPMTNNLTYHNYTLASSNVYGIYDANVVCNDGTLWGFSNFQFMINNSGDNSSPSGFLTVIILIPLILAFLFIIGSVVLSADHLAMKIGLLLLSWTMFFFSSYLAMVNIIKFYNFGDLQEAYSTTIYALGIVFIVIYSYWIIYLVYKVFHTIAENKKEKLEY